jgi:Flp pilus assembly protein TadD
MALGALLLAGCVRHSYRSEFEFANKLAREGLWQEAYYRLQKVRATGDDSAALHNNMAVVLESMGRYDEAKGEYEIALKLDPGNEQIQGNFNKFKKSQAKDDHEKK